MGGLFSTGGTKRQSLIGPQQKGLHSQLVSQFLTAIDDTSGVDSINELFRPGNNRVREMSNQLFNGILGSSFEGNFKPIKTLSGVLSNTFSKDAQANKLRIDQNAFSTKEGLVSSMIGLQLAGIGKRNELFLAPMGAATRFATNQSRAPFSTDNGPGFGIAQQIATFAGLAAINGGGNTGGTNTNNPQGMWTNRSPEDFARIKGYT